MRRMSFASDQVILLKAAYTAVLRGQSVRMGERMVTRADAAWIGGELDRWLRREAAEAAAAAGRSPGVAIADFNCGRAPTVFGVAE